METVTGLSFLGLQISDDLCKVYMEKALQD